MIAAAFACLAGVGYAAGLVHFKHSSATSAQYPTSKVTICHHTHSQKNPFVTITVSEHALPAHLGHGDTVGACTPQQGSTQTEVQSGKPQKEKPSHQSHGKSAAAHARKAEKAAAKASTSSRGKALGHGKSGTHGNGHGQNSGQTKDHGQGKGNGKGHDKTTSHGHGQGHGQGHGPGGTHGNSGGGKGKGHKP